MGDLCKNKNGDKGNVNLYCCCCCCFFVFFNNSVEYLRFSYNLSTIIVPVMRIWNKYSICYNYLIEIHFIRWLSKLMFEKQTQLRAQRRRWLKQFLVLVLFSKRQFWQHCTLKLFTQNNCYIITSNGELLIVSNIMRIGSL